MGFPTIRNELSFGSDRNPEDPWARLHRAPNARPPPPPHTPSWTGRTDTVDGRMDPGRDGWTPMDGDGWTTMMGRRGLHGGDHERGRRTARTGRADTVDGTPIPHSLLIKKNTGVWPRGRPPCGARSRQSLCGRRSRTPHTVPEPTTLNLRNYRERSPPPPPRRSRGP
eukprot:gene19025-biopygen20496